MLGGLEEVVRHSGARTPGGRGRRSMQIVLQGALRCVVCFWFAHSASQVRIPSVEVHDEIGMAGVVRGSWPLTRHSNLGDSQV